MTHNHKLVNIMLEKIENHQSICVRPKEPWKWVKWLRVIDNRTKKVTFTLQRILHRIQTSSAIDASFACQNIPVTAILVPTEWPENFLIA